MTTPAKHAAIKITPTEVTAAKDAETVVQGVATTPGGLGGYLKNEEPVAAGAVALWVVTMLGQILVGQGIVTSDQWSGLTTALVGLISTLIIGAIGWVTRSLVASPKTQAALTATNTDATKAAQAIQAELDQVKQDAATTTAGTLTDADHARIALTVVKAVDNGIAQAAKTAAAPAATSPSTPAPAAGPIEPTIPELPPLPDIPPTPSTTGATT